MLRVTVEVVPGGDEERARILDRVILINHSGLADVSDYYVSSEDSHKVATVRGHRRADGWQPLVSRALEALCPDKMGRTMSDRMTPPGVVHFAEHAETPELARFQVNPDELVEVERRDSVTALGAIREWMKARTRADRLRVWHALGGLEAEFDEEQGAL